MENKRLERNPMNKVIGGVCSGLADYFGLDIALVRIAFVIAFLFASFGFWLYIILWMVLPERSQQTTTNSQQPITKSLIANRLISLCAAGIVRIVFSPLLCLEREGHRC